MDVEGGDGAVSPASPGKSGRKLVVCPEKAIEKLKHCKIWVFCNNDLDEEVRERIDENVLDAQSSSDNSDTEGDAVGTSGARKQQSGDCSFVGAVLGAWVEC